MISWCVVGGSRINKEKQQQAMNNAVGGGGASESQRAKRAQIIKRDDLLRMKMMRMSAHFCLFLPPVIFVGQNLIKPYPVGNSLVRTGNGKSSSETPECAKSQNIRFWSVFDRFS